MFSSSLSLLSSSFLHALVVPLFLLTRHWINTLLYFIFHTLHVYTFLLHILYTFISFIFLAPRSR
jgi:hypothetical protein